MELLQNLYTGFSLAVSPTNLLFAAIGVIYGTITGALPGIGSVTAVALLLPLTFTMNPTTALIMLAGIYYGVAYGGTITAVLINVPGDSSAVMTTLDGYQLALQGRAGPALSIAAIGSFIAGTISTIILMGLAPPLAKFALRFGPPEYFALAILAFSLLTAFEGRQPIKIVVSTLLGLLIATVGLDVVSGLPRFTFDSPQLLGGISFVTVIIGLFGIGEVLSSVEQEMRLDFLRAKFRLRDVFPTWQDWIASRWAILRGTIIGFLVGILPGAGATTASFLAYLSEKRLSKHPERFGRGAIEGVASPESANNAACIGAFAPLLALGIPGSATTAVLLAGFMIWGIRPGPMLFQRNADLVWALIASMYIGNLMLVLLNIFFIPAFVAVLRIPYTILMPLIVVFSTMGAFSVNNDLFDVWLMLGFGVLGYLMKKLDYPVAPMVLALVLGPFAENSLRQAFIISGGSLSIFFTRPISAVLMGLAILAYLYPLIRWAVKSVRQVTTAATDLISARR
ncbi:MAG: tripartite tricarboxylate transporter permease [Armatimonadota bacterium]|nr:tripartite tricarboxylate transporter permease [Armatimonadota bacterium]